MPLIDQLQDLAKAMSSIGISVYDATQAIMRMNEALNRIADMETEVADLKDSIYDLKYEGDNIQSELDCRTTALEMKLSDLRPAMDAKTENPNQKGDLEISSQIEVNPFLSHFVDLDSEEFKQQRPLWDFTVDF